MFLPVSVPKQVALVVVRFERVTIIILDAQLCTFVVGFLLDCLNDVRRLTIQVATISRCFDPRNCSMHDNVKDVQRINCGIYK